MIREGDVSDDPGGPVHAGAEQELPLLRPVLQHLDQIEPECGGNQFRCPGQQRVDIPASECKKTEITKRCALCCQPLGQNSGFPQPVGTVADIRAHDRAYAEK